MSMKYRATSEDRQRRANGKPRPPLMTIQELSEELGLTLSQLRARLAAQDDAPKAVLAHQSPTGRRTWYQPEQVRQWWKKQVGETA